MSPVAKGKEMDEPQYSIVFQGKLIEGVSQDQACAQLMKAFSIAEAQARAILSRANVVLKRGLSEDHAIRYVSKLRQMGLIAVIDPPLIPPASRKDVEVPAPPPSVAPAPASAAGQLSLAPIEPRKTAPQKTGDGAATEAHGAGTGGGGWGGIRDQAPPPPSLSPSSADHDGGLRVLRFEFSGDGVEYFKIWIVNVLLSIITLSLYSAWAKVRTMRYFYGNTQLDGSAFEYLADPFKIFKGRMIALVFLIIYVISDSIGPVFALICGAIMLVATPWIITRSLRFRARYSAWRGVRFNFSGTMGGAAIAYILWYFLSAITLGLLSPLWYHRQMHYVVDHMHYGGAAFVNNASGRDFYMVVFLPLLGIAIGCAFIAGIAMSIAYPLGVIAMTLSYCAVFSYFRVTTINLRYDGTTIGPHGLQSDYELKSYFLLVLTNTLGILFTLGLFYPFARVRTARYAAEHINVVLTGGDLSEFIAQQTEDLSALGSEVDDLFDLDIGF
jgi:uncharacterized membrane protein YjgN (DUF898 family)